MGDGDDWGFLDGAGELPPAKPDSGPPQWRGDRRSVTAQKLAAQGRKDAFLEHFRFNGNASASARLVGVSVDLVYKHWKKHDPVFEARFQAAATESVDWLKHEAYRRAVEGVDEPVVYQGLPTMLEQVDPVTGETSKTMFVIKRYSDGLLTTLLKARAPDEFRENSKVTHEAGAGGVLIVPAPIAMADWERMAREAADAAAVEAATRRPVAAPGGLPRG